MIQSPQVKQRQYNFVMSAYSMKVKSTIARLIKQRENVFLYDISAGQYSLDQVIWRSNEFTEYMYTCYEVIKKSSNGNVRQ